MVRWLFGLLNLLTGWAIVGDTQGWWHLTEPTPAGNQKLLGAVCLNLGLLWFWKAPNGPARKRSDEA